MAIGDKEFSDVDCHIINKDPSLLDIIMRDENRFYSEVEANEAKYNATAVCIDNKKLYLKALYYGCGVNYDIEYPEQCYIADLRDILRDIKPIYVLEYKIDDCKPLYYVLVSRKIARQEWHCALQ